VRDVRAFRGQETTPERHDGASGRYEGPFGRYTRTFERYVRAFRRYVRSFERYLRGFLRHGGSLEGFGASAARSVAPFVADERTLTALGRRDGSGRGPLVTAESPDVRMPSFDVSGQAAV
jgi:hypothetical protein